MEELDPRAEKGRDCSDCVFGGGADWGVLTFVPCAEKENEDGERHGTRAQG